jgi:glucose dehydrogenase
VGGITAAVVLGGAAVAGVSLAPAASNTITAPPAFSTAQSTTYAGNDWINAQGGDVQGDRYSTLTTINSSNVGTLKQAWVTDLGICPSHTSVCGSMEASPAEYQGTLYFQTPHNGVYALDATTGKVLWNFVPPYATWDPGFSPGSGGRQPGVTLANGLVFAGFADGSLVALNAQTGQLAWRAVVGPWQAGVRLSSAPVYYNGIIYEPTAGGDGGGISCQIMAYNALNGALLWAWNVVPQAGQPGSNTWSTGGGGVGVGNAYGGGAFWQTPSIDAKDNLLIIGTGNPVPWNSRGPGANLYTDSLVALDLYSGQLKWYYQTVRHDMWDSDLPNSTIVFNTKMKSGPAKGQSVTAVGDVAKFGWMWLLNAKTGKPLTKVDEVKVPQDSAPGVNTWPTQPIPQTPNTLSPAFPSMKNGSGRLCSSAQYWDEPMTTSDGHPIVFGCDFDPYDTTQWIVAPFENMDWPASSYSPITHGFVTCGDNGREFGHEQIPAASEVIGSHGGIGAGVLNIGGNIPATNTGNFSSYNVQTNKWNWHQEWPAVCFSGSVDTASGLTFVGHLGTGNANNGDGYLAAVDTKTGNQLWASGNLGAEAAAPPITYSVNGTQYVAELVGGEGHEQPDATGGYGSYIYAFALPSS